MSTSNGNGQPTCPHCGQTMKAPRKSGAELRQMRLAVGVSISDLVREFISKGFPYSAVAALSKAETGAMPVPQRLPDYYEEALRSIAHRRSEALSDLIGTVPA